MASEYYSGFGKHISITDHQLEAVQVVPRRRRKLQTFSFLTLALLLSLAFWSQASVPKPVALNVGGGHAGQCGNPRPDKHMLQDFNWNNIKPAHKLNWASCYDGMDCARLSVPLDYINASAGEAVIAMLRVPASVPPGSKDHKGPILINPGGPGGSGVTTVLSIGKQLQQIVGTQFDIVGFDPRGVGLTAPTYQPFSSPLHEAAWILEGDSSLNLTSGSLAKEFVRSQIVGDLSARQQITRYMSTPTVARDMLTIVKAHGMDKIQYWGFSYGTILGATFAAMFPNHIGRFIIDGVVDSDNYYAALWSNAFIDTDKSFYAICEDCVAAGPDGCQLYHNSTEEVHDHIMNIVAGLRSTPAHFYNHTVESYDILDSGDVSSAIFTALYAPHAFGEPLIQALAALEKGDAYPIWQMTTKPVVKGALACTCPTPDISTYLGQLTTYAIACSDGLEVTDDLNNLRKYYAELSKSSELAAPLWPARLACSGWKVPAKEQFKGNFSVEHETSHPILLIGNTADPVTPLWAAHKISKSFKDSVVLTQDSAGHCSISAVSMCTMLHIRDHFRTGTLPAPGTVCGVDSSTFGNTLHINMDQLNDDERDLVEAAHQVQQNYFIPHFGAN